MTDNLGAINLLRDAASRLYPMVVAYNNIQATLKILEAKKASN